jgi:dihydrofolate synthase/folylpolyglutamate synthase
VGAYEETLAYLTRLEVSAGWDLKLERMRAALARRGHPEGAWPAIHVAGTNGKGSTAAMLDAVLTAAGWRTGLYTSPHLVDFTERIRVGGRTIPREAVVSKVAALRADLEAAGIALTHFEFATLVAFEWFRDVGVEAAVIEVGLGGRLDATNLCRPIVTAITTIAHDHEEWLGHSLPEIAAEKAGIVKPGVPLAIGRMPAEAEAVIAARADAAGAPLRRAPALVEEASGLAFAEGAVRWSGLRVGLAGAFQRENAAVALTALALAAGRLSCPPEAVRAGLARVVWPGRLAVVRRTSAPRSSPDPASSSAPSPATGPAPGRVLVLDGAHNPAGAATLARELPAVLDGRPVVLLFAVMADKAWAAMLEPLLPFLDRAVVTRVGRRGLDPARVVEGLAGRLPATAIEEPRAALAAAERAAGADGVVLVTGSLFLVGEVYAATGISLFEPWQG